MSFIQRLRPILGLNTRDHKILSKDNYLADAQNVITNDYNDIELRPGIDYVASGAAIHGLVKYFTNGTFFSLGSTIYNFILGAWVTVRTFGTFASETAGEINDTLETNDTLYITKENDFIYKYDGNSISVAGGINITGATYREANQLSADFATTDVSVANNTITLPGAGSTFDNRIVTFTSTGAVPSGINAIYGYYGVLIHQYGDVYKVSGDSKSYMGGEDTVTEFDTITDVGTGTHTVVTKAADVDGYYSLIFRLRTVLANGQILYGAPQYQGSNTIVTTYISPDRQKNVSYLLKLDEAFASTKIVYGYLDTSVSVTYGSSITLTLKAGHNVAIGDYLFLGINSGFSIPPVNSYYTDTDTFKVTNVVGNVITLDNPNGYTAVGFYNVCTQSIISNVNLEVFLDYSATSTMTGVYKLYGYSNVIPRYKTFSGVSNVLPIFVPLRHNPAGDAFVDLDVYPESKIKPRYIEMYRNTMFAANTQLATVMLDISGSFSIYTGESYYKIAEYESYPRYLMWSVTNGDVVTDSIENFSVDNSTEVGTNEDGNITGLKTNNESLVIFKERGIYYLTGTPQTNEMVLRKLEGNNVGCTCNSSIQEVNSTLFFLAENGIYGFRVGMDAPIEISEKIKDLFNTGTKTYATSCHDYIRKRYILHVPGMSSKTFVYNYVTNSWWLWTGIDAAGGMMFDGKDVYYTGSTGKTFKLVETQSYDDFTGTGTTKIDAYLVTPFENAGTPCMMKKWTAIKIYSLYAPECSVNVELYTDWENTKVCDQDTIFSETNKVYTQEIKPDASYRQCKSMSLKMSNVNVSEKFKVSGWEFELESNYAESRGFSKASI